MIYAPRPTNATTLNDLPYYEGQWGQAKFNGCCTVVKDGAVFDRYGKPQAWKIDLPSGIYFGEYMNKGGLYKGLSFIIWDAMEVNGNSLISKTLKQRFKAIHDNFQIIKSLPYAFQISEKVGIVKNLKKNLPAHYTSIIEEKILEGLVIKSPDSILRNCRAATSNSNWQVKIRKPNKMYSY